MSDIWIPIFIAITIISTVIGYFYFTHKTKESLQNTIRSAIDKGSELSPDLITKLAAPADEKKSDLRRGILIGLLTVAFVTFMGLLDGAKPQAVALGLFPGSIALGYFIMWKFTHKDD